MYAAFLGLLVVANARSADTPSFQGVIRSARSGPWSAPTTWEGANVPGAGSRVLIRTGHSVLYDVSSDAPLRVVQVAGALRFAADRDTRLDVGLLKVQPGEEVTENGFDCSAHLPAPDLARPLPALEVGTTDHPIDANHTALVQLVYLEGMERDSCPAIVCCGGRMDFHGATMSRTWVKLGATAKSGERTISLAEPVAGWRKGDRIVLTATTRQNKQAKTFRPSVKDSTQTEERLIESLDGTRLVLDKPLSFKHLAGGEYRADVANLSRNVVVESADPEKGRGHTMYHRNSAGSISYSEFRHLGKEGVLGRYSLHFHLAGDTMRGSSVIGASIWDSGNRWVTIHGTNYLVVRDCVGYKSAGHGFFLEDGTEVFNVLDRNLAIQAFIGKPLPQQVLPFDQNDGSGFWWSNCLNTFTRNVAAECDEYGYFFQAPKTKDFDPSLNVQQPDGSRKAVDIRTLPFVRFEDNEAHCMRRHAFNLGGGPPNGNQELTVAGVGPDVRHPFIIRGLKVWNSHWAFHPVSPSVLVDGADFYEIEYGVWKPVYQGHAYRGIKSNRITVVKEFQPKGTTPVEASFPKPLDPLDDLPPVTVITHVQRVKGDKLLVRGTTSDNGEVRKVTVNGQPSRSLGRGFAEWEIELPATVGNEMCLTALAEDAAGNVEPRPHVVVVPAR
jgi:hypothetical protein